MIKNGVKRGVNQTSSNHLDVVIVGGGPTGINCGIECQKAGLNYVIVEKGVIVNSIYNFPFNMTFFSTSKKLEIGEVPFISHNEKPTRSEALEYYRRLVESYDLSIMLGKEVISISQEKNLHKISLNDNEEIFAKNVIIATGFYDNPRLLKIPGENLSKVKHYYDDVHLYVKKNVVVVGGANSACDVALECWQKGANVTMVVREPELYQKVKYWILPNIENRIKEGSIKAFFNSKLIEIKEGVVVVETPSGITSLENDYVLAMTGYMPDLSWIKSLGIDLINNDERAYINAETLESNVPGIYLAGVVVSGLKTSELFIENTRNHPEIIVGSILQKNG